MIFPLITVYFLAPQTVTIDHRLENTFFYRLSGHRFNFAEVLFRFENSKFKLHSLNVSLELYAAKSISQNSDHVSKKTLLAHFDFSMHFKYYWAFWSVSYLVCGIPYAHKRDRKIFFFEIFRIVCAPQPGEFSRVSGIEW